jgi:diguanylate cyclase (GGDEF)-like protein/PAS domain S-box-containing protein
MDRGTFVVRKTPVMLRHALLSLSFVLLYLLFTRPEVIIISHIGLVAWYPATGLVLALMVAISPGYALVVLFADALSEVFVYHQSLWSFSLAIGAIGATGFYAAAAYLLRGRFAIDLGLRHQRDVVRYVSVTTVAALGATVISVACLAADHAILPGEFWQSALGWFFGDEIGLLGVAPFLLIHIFPWLRTHLSPDASRIQASKTPFRETKLTLGSLFEAAGQGATLLVVLWVMFGRFWGHHQYFYLSFIPITWVAMRHGIRRVVTALLLLNFGIVVALHFYPSDTMLTKVGLLMLVISAVGLIVGSAVSERQRMSIDLREQTTYLDSLIQNSPLGIVVLDPQGRVELANNAFKRLFLYGRTELTGMNIHSLFSSEDGIEEKPQLPELLFAATTATSVVRRRRRDGEILDLELHTVPVVANGKMRGAYTIYKDISEQTTILALERQHADSLNRLIKELEARTRQTTLLNEMSNLLDCCVTMGEAGSAVAQSVQKLFPEAVSGTLYIFKSSRNAVEAAASWGTPNPSESSFAPEVCWALRRGQPHWSDHLSGGVTCSHLVETDSMNCLCVPLIGQGNTLGILHLKFANTGQLPQDASPADLQNSLQMLGATVAGQIALSLDNLQLRETLREQSIRDPLTGLFNRRFMQDSLERELHRAQRKKHPLSVLLVDLDHFKRFNDTFGHDAGDSVLRALADVFKIFFRADDVVCRQGGEEFAFILPESSSEDAVRRADALREKAKQLNLKYEGRTLGMITLSIGVATFPEHGSSSGELLKVADRCLYQSKAAGRDMVTAATIAEQLNKGAFHAFQ